MGGYRGRNSHGGGNNWHNRHHHNDHHNGGSYHNQPNVNDDDILLTFKAWVMKQDDNINEDDACKNFKLHKTEFKKKQMQEFFVTHKDEECQNSTVGFGYSRRENVETHQNERLFDFLKKDMKESPLDH